MRLAKYSHPPKSVSSDFGQLAVNRHFSSGIDWAMAGAAIADVASPTPAAFEKFPSFHDDPPCRPVRLEFFRRRALAQEFNIYRRATTKRIAPSPALRRVH